jgi:N-methylhydantoinase A
VVPSSHDESNKRLSSMRYRISIDTGGTFTDVVVADRSGRHVVGKALTTPARTFDGIRIAMTTAGEELGIGLADLLADTDVIIYGTTHATNAIVTRKVAKTAFLTTEGFPDILVLKEGGKFDPHDFSMPYPEPYIPRRHTFEIAERIGPEGQVLLPLNRNQARTVLKEIEADGFEAVAVCFVWSIANPAHELAVGALIEEMLPGTPYTLSHRLIPIVREYRRASTTAIDASLKPLIQRHLRDMERDLRAAGYAGEILISTSIGGCMHVDELTERPVHAVKSGPAMAPVAGKFYIEQEKLGRDAIVCDTGGTTFDVGLIRDGSPVYTRDSWLGRQWIGDLISMSSVDVRSIGAGGGSIAWIDAGGLLQVGPESAGSDPGPACYGLGGNRPTVTDAAVVLGYLDPDYFVGGRMKLDMRAAERVMADLGRRMDRSAQEAAYAVLLVANELMIKAIREITVIEGINPRDSVIVAGGGAAGLNIMPIAQELGCTRVVLPKTASALSACGMQFSDIVKDHSLSHFTRSGCFDYDGVNAALQNIDAELRDFLSGLEARGMEHHRIEYFVEARYLFQVWELEVPLPCRRFHGRGDLDALIEAFHQVHERVFAVRDDLSEVECLNWKGRLSVHLTGKWKETAIPSKAVAMPHDQRPAYFGGADSVMTPIFRGLSLPAGASVAGPAIIEVPTTTLVVYPGMSARVTGAGNFLIELPS